MIYNYLSVVVVFVVVGFIQSIACKYFWDVKIRSKFKRPNNETKIKNKIEKRSVGFTWSKLVNTFEGNIQKRS